MPGVGSKRIDKTTEVCMFKWNHISIFLSIEGCLAFYSLFEKWQTCKKCLYAPEMYAPNANYSSIVTCGVYGHPESIMILLNPIGQSVHQSNNHSINQINWTTNQSFTQSTNNRTRCIGDSSGHHCKLGNGVNSFSTCVPFQFKYHLSSYNNSKNENTMLVRSTNVYKENPMLVRWHLFFFTETLHPSTVCIFHRWWLHVENTGMQIWLVLNFVNDKSILSTSTQRLTWALQQNHRMNAAKQDIPFDLKSICCSPEWPLDVSVRPEYAVIPDMVPEGLKIH